MSPSTSGKNERLVDVAIVGGGPAGCAAAIAMKSNPLLAEREVVIIERDEFPRYKVCGCCLNGAAESVLETLELGGMLNVVGAVPLKSWRASFHGRQTSVALPTGWALSRSLLDTTLMRHAAERGTEVWQPATARIEAVTGTDVLLRVQFPGEESRVGLRARHVVIASGLGAQIPEPWLPWKRAPGGPIGVGAVVSAECGAFEPGVIYMAVGATGYVGAVVLEDGQIDLAAALYDPRPSTSGQSIGDQIETLLQRSGFPWKGSTEPIRWHGTPPLTRQRRTGQGRLLAVGDAAGYIEPFTGEGMAWGLQTGILAARAIFESEIFESDAGDLPAGDRYRTLYAEHLSQRRVPCRMVTMALKHRFLRQSLFGALRIAPGIAWPMVRWINHSPLSRETLTAP